MTVDLKVSQEVIDLITGGWRAQAVYTAARLRLPDHIEAGRTTSRTLAEAAGAEPDGIRRLMRLLVAMGVFEGDDRAGYRNTSVSSALLDRPGTMREMCLLYGEEFHTAWAPAPAAISTLRAGFQIAFGEPLYARLGHDEELNVRFQGAMEAGNLFFDHVPGAYPFAGKRVVDVGGGNGHLLATILAAAPDASGVLIDREHVAPIAREHLATTVGLDRVDVVGGDMLEAVPPGGDVYLLCRVLAGWRDEDVVRVFTNCRRAMAGPSARLIVLDRVVVDEESTVLPALWDLHLLMTVGGRHRTVAEFRTLLDLAGLDLERIVELPVETSALIATPRG